MKKLIFLSLLAVLFSCKKGVYPEFSITTKVLSNGDVVITGKMLNPSVNGSSYQHIGYCYSNTESNPSIEFAQKVFSYASSFSDTIQSQYLVANSKYYFKVFGVNDYGRGESEVSEVTTITGTSTSPCNLGENKFKVVLSNGGSLTSSVLGQGYFSGSTSTTKEYTCDLPNGSSFIFTFKVIPDTGTYNIYNNMLPNNSSVVIYDTQNSNFALNGSLNITKINNSTFKIDMCDVPWFSGSYYYTSLSMYATY